MVALRGDPRSDPGCLWRGRRHRDTIRRGITGSVGIDGSITCGLGFSGSVTLRISGSISFARGIGSSLTVSFGRC